MPGGDTDLRHVGDSIHTHADAGPLQPRTEPEMRRGLGTLVGGWSPAFPSLDSPCRLPRHLEPGLGVRQEPVLQQWKEQKGRELEDRKIEGKKRLVLETRFVVAKKVEEGEG